MGNQEGYEVLAMYDVRGIQNYIYRTPLVKEIIGASAIIEDIIEKALADAMEVLGAADDDVSIINIGGGNGIVLCRTRDLCVNINKHMAKYIVEKTYSLQLCSAMVTASDNYKNDYDALMLEMGRIKSQMVISKPVGALPVAKVEVRTGFSASADKLPDEIGKSRAGSSKENLLKLERSKEERKGQPMAEKIFDNYIMGKGVDSTIAVVHLDGNNMGLRLRAELEGKTVYKEAVEHLSTISKNIDESYKATFEAMSNIFNAESQDQNFVLKILTAGDDITYVCNGQIALATVEYFCNDISKKTLTGDPLTEENKNNAFSVCAGIAYMHSHFPFHVAYDVAEACCDSAKDFAKTHKDDGFVGNWVDFHVCKNVHARHLDEIRDKEYVSGFGEKLMLRPYYICDDSQEIKTFRPKEEWKLHSYENFKSQLRFFQNPQNLPHTFAKELRNVYYHGEIRVKALTEFLKSRGWKSPEGNEDWGSAFQEDEGRKCALWYDALEMMDCYKELTEQGYSEGKGENDENDEAKEA